ncbi:DUF488 domain-containing protein [Pseudalkalibacillus caeni]|uniref:DUF488 family protein n=1 Tax=Exobacillus caeni TaxID=2574798 RepID=A0A5R9F3W5_9BACL|nr:DUF488 family protein [Pseudalkalibacillus caeni]TLS37189.1 DUF488 family protein [Pseudalkalibacillus caeni]
MAIVLQRIYGEKTQAEGYRILIDRLWPRGISKQNANLDEWAKEIAPSTTLRKRYNNKPEEFDAFKQAYKAEIYEDPEKLARLNALKDLAKNERIILLYGSKDERYNHAIVLKEMLEEN